MLKRLFGCYKPIIGVVHLLPLPGAPKFKNNFDEVITRAKQDAIALENGGVNGIIVENYGDIPFKPEVGLETVAAMTYVAGEVTKAIKLPFGINVLRNDAKAALAIATAVGAKFIRINVHTDAMVTDQGLIEGKAYETLRYRRTLNENINIFADIFVKHAAPAYLRPIETVAYDTAYRGLADALIVTGSSTGKPPLPEDVVKVKKAVPDKPVIAGSGISEKNVKKILENADGAIVGTSFKFNAITENPVDEKRVKKLVKMVKQLR